MTDPVFKLPRGGGGRESLQLILCM